MTVLTMPGTRAAWLPARSLEKRAELLAELARRALDLPAELVEDCVAIYAAESLRPAEREAYWQTLLHHWKLSLQGDDGDLDWRTVDPDLTCSDRKAVAAEIARQDYKDTLQTLVSGLP